MTILITGAAGFIGYSLASRLLARGDAVRGVDNLNAYYDVALKEARLERLQRHRGFGFSRLDIADREQMRALFEREHFDSIVHLAAQAGVRYSIEHPMAYVDSNLVGFANVIDGARRQSTRHFVFASSSSVYGANKKLPFAETDNVDHPITLYAATKKANELMAHSYAHLFGLPCTGLRFFTVYGPWGRPDMALFKFTRGILAGEAIPVFNHGKMVRDFTYVDDIVEGLVRVLDRPPARDAGAGTSAPYELYNIGNNRPIELMQYIRTLESCLGKQAKLDLLPMQPGDVAATVADVSKLERAVGFRPTTTVEEGIRRFVEWYREFYAVR